MCAKTRTSCRFSVGRLFFHMIGRVLGPLVVFSALASFLACTTFPPAAPVSKWLSMLPGDAAFHVSVRDPSMIKALFYSLADAYGLGREQAARMAEPTDQAFFSLSNETGKGPVFHALLVGRFSPWSIDTGFSSSPDWSKTASRYAVWKNKKEPISVANPLGYLVVATNGDIEKTFLKIDRGSDSVAFPQHVLSLFESSSAAFYLPHPGYGDGAVPFNREKVPLEEITAFATGNSGSREITALFPFDGKGDAGIFSTSLRTFVVWIMRKCGISDFARRIAISGGDEGVRLVFSGVTETELSAMLGFAAKGGK